MSSRAPILAAILSVASDNSSPSRNSTLSRQRSRHADRSSTTLSAPKAMRVRLCAATPEPMATAASISIQPAVIHSSQNARLIGPSRLPIRLPPVFLGTRYLIDACDCPWSSARAHPDGRVDSFLQVRPLLHLVADCLQLPLGPTRALPHTS